MTDWLDVGEDVRRRTKPISCRQQRARIRYVGVALGAIILSACAGDTAPESTFITTVPFSWSPRSVSTVLSSTLTGTIQEIWVAPYPEGSNYVTYRDPDPSHAGANIANGKIDAFLKLVGWPLPEPLDQPTGCTPGIPNYTVIVVFDTGAKQSYGPCVRPAMIDQAVEQIRLGD